jgi:hypothetical protein
MRHLETRATSTVSSMTNTTALVETAGVADFNALGGSAAVSSLWPLGIQLAFSGRGAIAVPGYAASPNSMAFTQEGLPIPTEQGVFAAVTLAPRKFAGIVSFTRELFLHSIPTVESVVRMQMSDSFSLSMDAAALGTVAGDAVVVAGLRNGISSLTPSALTVRSEAMAADIAQLLAGANGIVGPASVAGNSPIIFIASPAQAEALRNQPNFKYAVLSSNGIAAKTVIACASKGQEMMHANLKGNVGMSAAPSRTVHVEWPEWRAWLTDEIASLPFDERAEILADAMCHDIQSLTKARRFQLADALRNFADRVEVFDIV